MTEHFDKRMTTFRGLINKPQKGERVADYSSDAYQLFATSLYQEAVGIFSVANREYSSDDSWTSNFDFVATMMRMGGFEDFRPRDAAATYLMKSIFSIVKDNSERQSMRSRYIDAINYLTFMAWMDENNHDVAITYPGE